MSSRHHQTRGRGTGTEADAGQRRTRDGGFSLDTSVSRTHSDEGPFKISKKRTEADAGRRWTKSVPRALHQTRTVNFRCPTVLVDPRLKIINGTTLVRSSKFYIN